MKGRSFFVSLLSVIAVLSLFESAYSRNASSIPPSSIKLVADSPQATSNSERIHIVRRGDNLIKLSRVFDTSPEVLKSVNGLKDSKILIGQELRIPIPPSDDENIPATDAKNNPIFSYTPAMISEVLLQRDARKDTVKSEPPRRIRLIKAGFELLGVRYRFSGRSEKQGFDCSGLVTNLFSKFDIELPHSSREQFRYGEKVTRDRLKEGDLVFFSSGEKFPNHVGIYIGNDQFLHAASKAHRVIVSDLNKLWYAVRFLGARRIMDLWGDDSEPPSTNN